MALKPSGIDVNKKWHIPGGIRDDISESLFQTAIREVKEETGIDISNETYKLIKIGEWTAIDKGEPVKILGVFFHLRLTKRPEIKLSNEHSDFVWINLSNYQSFDIHPDLKECVEIVFGKNNT